MTKKKIVVIGGGHGQSAILRGIKKIDDIDITADCVPYNKVLEYSIIL